MNIFKIIEKDEVLNRFFSSTHKNIEEAYTHLEIRIAAAQLNVNHRSNCPEQALSSSEQEALELDQALINLDLLEACTFLENRALITFILSKPNHCKPSSMEKAMREARRSNEYEIQILLLSHKSGAGLAEVVAAKGKSPLIAFGLLSIPFARAAEPDDFQPTDLSPK